MATLKIPKGNGGWEVVEATDPNAIHIDEPASNITIGSADGTTYEQKVDGKTLVISRTGSDDTIENYSNNISIGDGDIIPCTSEGLFGSKGYAYAVLKSGGTVYKSGNPTFDKTAVVMDQSEATSAMYAMPSETYDAGNRVVIGDNKYYYVHTGQVDKTGISGFNTFSFANGSALGNYTIAGGRGCFALAGKGINPNNSKFGVSIGYENVASADDDVLLGTRNYVFNDGDAKSKAVWILGSANVVDAANRPRWDTNGPSNIAIIGTGHKVSADTNTVIGCYNTSTFENCYLFGRRIESKDNYQTLLGVSPAVTDTTLFAIGDGNDSVSTHNAIEIIGDEYNSTANYSPKRATLTKINTPLEVDGDVTSNTNIRAPQIAIGSYPNVGNYTFTIGNGTSSTLKNFVELSATAINPKAYFYDGSVGICDASESSVSGYKNSLAVGQGVKIVKDNQLLVGKYTSQSTTAIFGVGNGTANSTSGRNLIFSVEADKVASTNPIYVNNKEVATKEYVDNTFVDVYNPVVSNGMLFSSDIVSGSINITVDNTYTINIGSCKGKLIVGTTFVFNNVGGVSQIIDYIDNEDTTYSREISDNGSIQINVSGIYKVTQAS